MLVDLHKGSKLEIDSDALALSLSLFPYSRIEICTKSENYLGGELIQKVLVFLIDLEVFLESVFLRLQGGHPDLHALDLRLYFLPLLRRLYYFRVIWLSMYSGGKSNPRSR